MMVNETQNQQINVQSVLFSELSGLGLYVKMDHVKAFNVGLLLLALRESPFLLILLQLKTTSVVFICML